MLQFPKSILSAWHLKGSAQAQSLDNPMRIYDVLVPQAVTEADEAENEPGVEKPHYAHRPSISLHYLKGKQCS